VLVIQRTERTTNKSSKIKIIDITVFNMRRYTWEGISYFEELFMEDFRISFLIRYMEEMLHDIKEIVMECGINEE
jgi:hypothetical protein